MLRAGALFLGDEFQWCASTTAAIIEFATQSLKKLPNKSQIEKDEEAKRHHQAMATWTTQREKILLSNTSNQLLPLSMVLKTN